LFRFRTADVQCHCRRCRRWRTPGRTSFCSSPSTRGKADSSSSFEKISGLNIWFTTGSSPISSLLKTTELKVIFRVWIWSFLKTVEMQYLIDFLEKVSNRILRQVYNLVVVFSKDKVFDIKWFFFQRIFGIICPTKSKTTIKFRNLILEYHCAFQVESELNN